MGTTRGDLPPQLIPTPPYSALFQLSPHRTQPPSNSAISQLFSKKKSKWHIKLSPRILFSKPSLQWGYAPKPPILKPPHSAFPKGLSCKRAELGKGCVEQGLRWARAGLRWHRADLGKGRAGLVEFRVRGNWEKCEKRLNLDRASLEPAGVCALDSVCPAEIPRGCRAPLENFCCK
jgi:hypothetical protein